LHGIGKKINSELIKMNTIIDHIKYRFKNAGIVEQLIYINIALFFTTLMANVFSDWFKSDANIIIEWFSLHPHINTFLLKPWTIITYGFFHGGFLHILSNLIILFYIGNLFLEYFSSKQLLQFYILGTLFGGILFLTGYNFIPLFKNDTAPLIGASAGVLAIFIGLATYIPNYQLKIRFIGYIHLWKIAVFFILLDFIQLSGNNAGGHFAHLGGALFGFLYVNSMSNTELKIFPSFKTENQQQVDAILDKISKSGYDTLTQEEKAFLFKQGKNQ